MAQEKKDSFSVKQKSSAKGMKGQPSSDKGPRKKKKKDCGAMRPRVSARVDRPTKGQTSRAPSVIR
jgi:hypothetical protein